MVEQERFNLFKFLGSFFQLLPWIKNIRYMAGFALVGFVGLTIYRAFLMPTQTTKQVTQIVAQRGAQVTVDQKREEKASGLAVHPFVEGYGFVESDKRTGAGGRAGLRVEF